MIYVLYNPQAGNNRGRESARQLDKLYDSEELRYVDMTEIVDYPQFLSKIEEDTPIILCGGDGTLNQFINATAGLLIPNKLLYYPTGSGNDFAHDVGKEAAAPPFLLNDYISSLPSVCVQGKTYYFLNGIGYGIDGYCCEVGDQLRQKSDKPINYTSIAIKGLLFHYKPTNAKITVDGVSRTYRKVWLAPTMNGRFYGGGMMPTPQQDRSNSDSLSIMVLHCSGKLKTLMVFPTIFKGKHIEHTEMVEVLTGKEITVEFDRPVALQIDGETILDVFSYQAASAISARTELIS